MKDEGEGRNPAKDFGWLILFLIVLGVIWFAQGGPSRLTSMTSPFLTVPTISPSIPSQDQSNPPSIPSIETSPYKGKVALRAYGVQETDPKSEYVEIDAAYNNTQSILITGWTLEGRLGISPVIGKGAYLVYSAQVNPQDSILLQPGERAIILTGHSPIGTNFKLNICTGYFNQFQNFYPSLPQECPRLSNKDIPINYSDECFNFVNSLPTCRMPLTAIPPAVGSNCSELIAKNASYNGCVNANKGEKNFYKPEWRIYLDRENELWAKRDVVVLKDQNGEIIDSVSY